MLYVLIGGCVSIMPWGGSISCMIAGAEVSEGEKPGFFMSLFGTVAERGVRVCLLEL